MVHYPSEFLRGRNRGRPGLLLAAAAVLAALGVEQHLLQREQALLVLAAEKVVPFAQRGQVTWDPFDESICAAILWI
jgi:hypothetical protein